MLGEHSPATRTAPLTLVEKENHFDPRQAVQRCPHAGLIPAQSALATMSRATMRRPRSTGLWMPILDPVNWNIAEFEATSMSFI